MYPYDHGSLGSNTVVFVLVILVLISFATVTRAKANNTPGIPVTGKAPRANLSSPGTIGATQPGSSAGARDVSQLPNGAYIVQAGDTLASIAERFNTTVNALQRANSHISNLDQLTAGETLYIPGSTVVIDGQTIYIVASGDDLFAIASRHNVTLADLEQANPQIKPPSLIFPGQWVTIP